MEKPAGGRTTMKAFGPISIVYVDITFCYILLSL